VVFVIVDDGDGIVVELRVGIGFLIVWVFVCDELWGMFDLCLEVGMCVEVVFFV